MGKKLNTAAVLSELSEGSAFFPSYKGHGSPLPEPKEPEPASSDGDKSSTPVRVVRDSPLVPPVKRVMKQRHPFDIYRDQYESLQQLALEERKRGGVGSMSAMVREGLDWIVAKKRKELDIE